MNLNLKIPPLAQAAIAIFLIWLFHRYAPLYHIKYNYQYLVARALIGIGAIVAVAGIFAFRKLNTTVDPRYPEKAKNLVIIGIYKYSRNPMYLGIFLILTGIVIYFGALSNIPVLFLFVVFINRYQIIPEETALQDKFGESYSRYTRTVRRWI